MKQKDLSNYRKSYEKSELNESSIHDNPLEQFNMWFDEVENSSGIDEPNAMTLSTIGIDGFPKSRVVLMKKITSEGFIFFTNYESEKGKALNTNPLSCLSFFWPNLERQVIIKGKSEKISTILSDTYFKSRPLKSQLGAIVSEQSNVVDSRIILEKRLVAKEKEYKGKEISRPDNWGGYIVKPLSIEFWQGRPNRLHDRIRYTLKDEGDWKIERLQP